MKVEKKVIGHLNKCYSMAPLKYQGKDRFLVAAEKQDPCYLYEKDGTYIENVWEQPGGVMTMVQVPGSDGIFLATHKFYSPNDSKEAKIVTAIPTEEGWKIQTLADAPFVHRFAILNRNGVNHLIVCCLKSDHEFKEDWNHPGAVYTAVLPDDVTAYDENNLLPLKKIKDGLLRNHGYSTVEIDGIQRSVVGTENGTFLFTPPETADGEWEIEQLCGVPSSDSILLDFDGDGQLELGSIAPFHGNSITIYHLDQHGNYVPTWKYGEPESDTEMVHATWYGELNGKPAWVLGWRKGTRNSIVITYNPETKQYEAEVFDTNAGAANFMHMINDEGEDVIVGTNREIDEIAMYTFKKED